MWKWKFARFGRLAVLQRTIKEEGHAHSQPRAAPFLLWFNEIPGCFTPVPNDVSALVAPRGVCYADNYNAGFAYKWNNDNRHRCRDQYFLRRGLDDLIHYGALLAVGFNVLHQWKAPVVRFNAIQVEQPSLLCPVKAIKDAITVCAQPQQSTSMKHVVTNEFKDLVIDEVPELQEKPNEETKLKDKDKLESSKQDTVEKVEQTLKDIENAVSLEILNTLGVQQFKNGNEMEGVDLLFQAAKKGSAKAFFLIGNAYERGVGLAKDLKNAAKFYSIASSLGSADASYNLAVFHFEGIGGVEVSEEKAVKLLTTAAEKGLDEACFALGLPLVKKTTNLEDDIFGGEHVISEELLDKGIGAYLDPIFNLAASMESGFTSVPQDSLYSLELYRIAADQGHVKATEAFFRLYKELFGDVTKRSDVGVADGKRQLSLKHVSSAPSMLHVQKNDKMYILERKAVSCDDLRLLERQEDSGVEDQRVILAN